MEATQDLAMSCIKPACPTSPPRKIKSRQQCLQQHPNSKTQKYPTPQHLTSFQITIIGPPLPKYPPTQTLRPPRPSPTDFDTKHSPTSPSTPSDQCLDIQRRSSSLQITTMSRKLLTISSNEVGVCHPMKPFFLHKQHSHTKNKYILSYYSIFHLYPT